VVGEDILYHEVCTSLRKYSHRWACSSPTAGDTTANPSESSTRYFNLRINTEVCIKYYISIVLSFIVVVKTVAGSMTFPPMQIRPSAPFTTSF
jgi:hypothetical protein